MLNKILLADSGSGHSEEMLKYLLELPALQKATITILHVVSPQVTSEAMTEKWEEGGKIVAQAIQSLNLDPDKVTTILRQGEPKDTVCQVAEEVDADLIIMGSRGLKRIESILENSVSQFVFQLSSRPLLLIKDDVYVKRLKRIMVALDRSDSAQYCLDLALFLLKDIPGGQLLLVHIDPGVKTETALRTGKEAEGDPLLENAANKARRQGVAYRCFLSGGKPAQKICNLARENNVDLLMLGSPDRRPSVAKGLPDFDRLFGASVSDYVRVNAECPVFIGRKQD